MVVGSLIAVVVASRIVKDQKKELKRLNKELKKFR